MTRPWLKLVTLVLFSSIVLGVIYQTTRNATETGRLKTNQPKADPVLIVIWETSNRGLKGVPIESDSASAVQLDEARRVLTVPQPSMLPSKDARLMVLHKIDSLDTALYSGLFSFKRLPARIDIGRPVSVWGMMPGKEAPENVFDPSTRFAGGYAFIKDIDPKGNALLSFMGEEVTIEPGSSWGMGWALNGSVPEVIRDEGQWAEKMGRHLKNGNPITVLTFINLGRWPQNRVLHR